MPSAMQDLAQSKRELRETRKHLKDLTGTVEAFLRLLDVEMRSPSNPARGSRIADLANKLNLANDIAKRFGLAKRKANKRPGVVLAKEQS